MQCLKTVILKLIREFIAYIYHGAISARTPTKTRNKKMGSEGNDVRLLPVIEFPGEEGLKPKTEQWEEVKSKVRRALEEYGCFEAKVKRIPAGIREAIFSAMEEVFDLPLQTKEQNISEKPFHGYLGQTPKRPLYESMGFEDADDYHTMEAITNTLWPQGNPDFSKTIQSYTEQLGEVDHIVRRMVVESFGLEKYLDEHLNSANYLLRLMKYTGTKTQEPELGLYAHADKNFLTILYQNQVSGLQILTKDGQWITVQPSPDSFIVLIGDALVAWTNGRLYSPVHRVMMAGKETRYSTALFAMPKAGHIVKTPQELVDEEHPLLFKPFDYVQFITFFYTEAGQKSSSALNDYCGVKNCGLSN